MKAIVFLCFLALSMSIEISTVSIIPEFLPRLNPTHYGNPTGGCLTDEVAVQIQGLTGDACIPACASGSCPTDVPTGTTASPVCALQDPSGNQYCALICQGPYTGNCPTGASCQVTSGVGICLFPQ